MVCAESADFSVISINDLLERYYRNERLGREEIAALINYERYQLKSLNGTDEEEFHSRFIRLQVMANLAPYQEFLKDEYSELL